MSNRTNTFHGVDKEKPDTTALNYPALFRSADRSSIKNQNHYLLGMKLYIGFSILGAAASASIEVFKVDHRLLPAISIAFFIIIIAITIYQGVKRFDRTWYNTRAVAESVKTRTWRYVMRAEPYLDAQDLIAVKKLFFADMRSILDQNKEVGHELLKDIAELSTITDSMDHIRAGTMEERLEYYKVHRTLDQLAWYKRKTDWNKRRAIQWFIGLIAAHASAIALLVIEMYSSNLKLPSEAIMVVASGILAWMQIKRFQDQATAYSLTANEIRIIHDQGELITTESELSDYVKDAENAFSREHTQWVARKDL